MHPMFRSININGFLESMKLKGYTLGNAYTVNGEFIINENLDYYFSEEVVNGLKRGELDGRQYLVVLNFSRN
jgi:hypothetical protein